MARFDIFDTIDEQRQKGSAFCVATVMRTADATSAKAGAKAVITRSGEIIGHLGGACVQRAVKTAASQAIQKDQTQVISVRPSDNDVGTQGLDGIQTFKSGCPSGGTVDLLIEPYRPPHKLVIFGETPISQALSAHAKLAGFQVFMQDGANDTGAVADLDIAEHDFVVIASQGNGDRDALLAAIQSPAKRISMIASARKASFLCQSLIAADQDAARVNRLKSPAGLDLGGVDPNEIAISVLAEIIAWRNSDVREALEPGKTLQA